jgi:RNA polymerase sigma factor (sigma-70 family)
MDRMDPRTDRELLAAAEPEALGVFYDRHERAVLAFFARRTADPEVAAELTAETFAEVVCQVRKRVAVREPHGWLWTIARSRLADYHRRGVADDRMRRRMGFAPLMLDDAALARIASLADDPRGVELPAALAALSVADREAVLARHVRELEYPEIAAEQGVSEQVARKRVSRALARLRQRLEKVV